MEPTGRDSPLSLDRVLESVLRGAAKTLGCGSANLIVFNEFGNEVRIRVGLILERQLELARCEDALGSSVNELSIPLDQTRETALYRAWRDCAVAEVPSLVELAKGAFPQELLAEADRLIGPRRFLVVPVLGESLCYGAIVFEKTGRHQFGTQQRELLILYANRMGEIFENDSRAYRIDSYQRDQRPDRSIQNHLLQIALQKSAPTLLVDPTFRITSCNSATQATLGYQSEELMGLDIGQLFRDPEDIRTILNHQFLAVSEGHHRETAIVKTRDGTLLTAKVEAVLLVDEDNHVIGYLVLIREQESREEPLDGEPGLDRLMRRERLANMGEIAAQLAHEIRNPLLAIGATLESLQLDRQGDDPDGPVLAHLSREIKRLDMILRDYLSLAVRRNTTIKRVNLGELVDEARDLLQGQQILAGKRIRSSLPTDLELLADYDGLKQVFFNLFINALEVSPEGRDVSCRCEAHDDEILIHVEDRGPGLKAEPSRCFTPFFSTKSNGTGLGLTVCRNILAAHSGSLQLANREGGGCRATVVVPRRRS
ncbi:MAG: ATP-binding protein [bacterium]